MANSRTVKPTQTETGMLRHLQKQTFDYFLREANPANGLIKDKTSDYSPCSIAAVGLALTAYPIGVEQGFCTRSQAVNRTLATLRFFAESEQSSNEKATGYKGFYYHFLDMNSGERVWQCELSTVDSALLFAGMLTAAQYFDRGDEDELEIQDLAAQLYARADWRWAQDGGDTVTMGWTSEKGFLRFRWEGYDEALILYVLGLGAPTFALPAKSYSAWMKSYLWKKIYGRHFLYAGPLFTHQLSHLWIDFRKIKDDFMREHDSDYFENSKHATHIQRAYAIKNPLGFEKYGENCWGITASDGPGPSVKRIHGIERVFYSYLARGVPFGPDDGTLAPWAVVASLPFAPDIVLPAIDYLNHLHLRADDPYGFKATFNPTFSEKGDGDGSWLSPYHYGINQGPIVIMIENHLSDLIWSLMRKCAPIVAGLKKAGFRGGWLESKRTSKDVS